MIIGLGSLISLEAHSLIVWYIDMVYISEVIIIKCEWNKYAITVYVRYVNLRDTVILTIFVRSG